MKKFVYQFKEASQLDCDRRALFGGKGANLAEMTKLGMPVPQGFTITTEACTQYYLDGEKINDEIQAQIMENIAKLEKLVGKEFGSLDNPLLVSVRSGARASMPGMMDTILNLGLNDEVVVRFAEKTGNPRFAYDSYRRFIQMYSDVVMEVGKKYFEQLIDEMKEKKGVKLDTELNADDLKALAEQFKAEYKAKIGTDFPQDPKEQLMGAVKAVFRSWNNDRAVYYRRMNDIPGDWGTAVNVQMMVFGNMGDTSGTGVAFSRNPATGEKGLFGEYLMNAQGEDVVAGVRTPSPISHLKETNPKVYEEFVEIVKRLEDHYRDMQDMEFTIEEGKLFMLQTRNGKRTAAAAVKIACDLVVGESGSGKSTLLRLLLGFETPGSGSIAYDGQDVSHVNLQALRSRIGVVLQDSRLLPDTVLRNIIGHSGKLTVDDAWEAARLAGCEQDIREMPMGMHTMLSAGGGSVSGGQRQRILIARALAKKPAVLLFDEATSALDNETQAAVSAGIERLRVSRLLIAHRLSTVMNADRIYVLHEGRMAECGTYRQLMEKDGVFARLARRQLAEAGEEFEE